LTSARQASRQTAIACRNGLDGQAVGVVSGFAAR
jgi:hypothetical protein